MQARQEIGFKQNWKQRGHVTHTYWNQVRPEHLDELLLCARQLLCLDGRFVSQSDLLASVRAASSDGSGGHLTGPSLKFRQWIELYLQPAVQCYHWISGAAGHEQHRIYYYMCPTSASSAANVRASFDELIQSADARSVERRLANVPVRAYLEHLPTRAAQRVR